MQTNNPGSLKEKFGNFGAAPTDQLWNSISSSLDQKEKKRRGVFWWWFTGIAASGILFVGIYYLGYQVGKNEINLTGESDVNATGSLSVNKRIEMTEAGVDDLKKGEDDTSPGSLSPADDSEKGSDVSSTGYLSSFEMTEAGVDDLERESDVIQDGFRSNPDDFRDGMTKANARDSVKISDEKITQLNQPKVQKIIQLRDDNFDLALANKFVKPEKTSLWEIGFSIGTQTNRGNAYSYDQSTYSDTTTNLATLDFQNENLVEGTGNFNAITPVSGSIARPLSIDFSVGRILNNRWSLKSGLGLNYTKSVSHYNSSDLVSVEMSIFSFSLPILAEFDFVKSKRFEFSSAAGIVNEIPFLSRTNSFSPLSSSSTNTSKSFIRGYMCSGLFNFGLSYRLNNGVKIGIHPNVRHYFFQSMKSDYPVIERKTWFGANVGLVWEI